MPHAAPSAGVGGQGAQEGRKGEGHHARRRPVTLYVNALGIDFDQTVCQASAVPKWPRRPPPSPKNGPGVRPLSHSVPGAQASTVCRKPAAVCPALARRLVCTGRESLPTPLPKKPARAGRAPLPLFHHLHLCFLALVVHLLHLEREEADGAADEEHHHDRRHRHELRRVPVHGGRLRAPRERRGRRRRRRGMQEICTGAVHG